MQTAMFIFKFLSTFLILCRAKICHGNEENNASPNDWEQFLSVSLEIDQCLNYDITYWMKPLLLQHCTFVEIGEHFCPLFIEIRDSLFVTHIVNNSHVIELFLGFCSCLTLHFWDLCSIGITKVRKSDCILTEVMVYDKMSTGVHQRLYNIFLLCTETRVSNYSMNMAKQQLYKTEGFPTCFQSQLPKSLCILYNFCGTAMNGIYSRKCITNCHQRQLFCKDAGLCTFMIPVVTSSWLQCSYPIYNNTYAEGQLVFCKDAGLCTFMIPVVTSSWLQCSYPIYNNTYAEGQLVVVTSCYNCSIKLKKCSYKFLTTSGTMTALRLTELWFSIIDYIQKDTHIDALTQLVDSSQKINKEKINEVYHDNDYKGEFLPISPKNLKYTQPLRRRLLQNIGHECYGRMGYNAQGDRSNYRRYVQFLGPAMNVGKDENEDKDEDEDDENYEVSDEKADNTFKEDEEGNENEEEEEDNELGHQTDGRWIRMERSNRIGLSHTNKKQMEYLTKDNVRIRSVSEECNEEPTEELQYYDYETNGIDTLLSRNTHKLQIRYFTRFTVIYLLIIFII